MLGLPLRKIDSSSRLESLLSTSSPSPTSTVSWVSHRDRFKRCLDLIDRTVLSLPPRVPPLPPPPDMSTLEMEWGEERRKEEEEEEEKEERKKETGGGKEKSILKTRKSMCNRYCSPSGMGQKRNEQGGEEEEMVEEQKDSQRRTTHTRNVTISGITSNVASPTIRVYAPEESIGFESFAKVETKVDSSKPVSIISSLTRSLGEMKVASKSNLHSSLKRNSFEGVAGDKKKQDSTAMFAVNFNSPEEVVLQPSKLPSRKFARSMRNRISTSGNYRHGRTSSKSVRMPISSDFDDDQPIEFSHKRTFVLKVLICLPGASLPPLNLVLDPHMVVEKVLELIVFRLSALTGARGVPQNFELRMCDDDDDSPDFDIPALERSRDISMFNVDCVALCPCKNSGVASRVASVSVANATIRNQSMTDLIGAVRVNIPAENASFIIPFEDEMLLCDVLAKISNKRKIPMAMDSYSFHVNENDSELSMATLVDSLGVEELILQPKLKQNPSLSLPGLDLKMMGYVEYLVKKTNKYGKRQDRVLGIDGDRIYNKLPEGGGFMRFLSVKNESRPMSTVVEAKFVKIQGPCAFQIIFHHDDSNLMIAVDYEAKSPQECVEIVDRITYIVTKRHTST